MGSDRSVTGISEVLSVVAPKSNLQVQKIVQQSWISHLLGVNMILLVGACCATRSKVRIIKVFMGKSSVPRNKIQDVWFIVELNYY